MPELCKQGVLSEGSEASLTPVFEDTHSAVSALSGTRLLPRPRPAAPPALPAQPNQSPRPTPTHARERSRLHSFRVSNRRPAPPALRCHPRCRAIVPQRPDLVHIGGPGRGRAAPSEQHRAKMPCTFPAYPRKGQVRPAVVGFFKETLIGPGAQ